MNAVVLSIVGVVVAVVVGIIVWSTAGGGNDDPATFEFEGEQHLCHSDDMTEEEADAWAVSFALEEGFAEAWRDGCGEEP